MSGGRRSTLAIFPLDAVVLFPRVSVPLHIFEPRYVQMTEAVLEGDRRIGMVTVRPEHAHEMRGDPPIFDVGCEGEITEVRKRPDGRYDLLLLGLNRFRLLGEVPRPADREYRVAEVVALEERLEPHEVQRLAGLRATLIDLMRVLMGRAGSARGSRLSRSAFEGVDDVTFVNALSQALEMPAVEKQGLLEAPGIRERYERLIEMLQFRLAEVDGGGPSEPGTLH